MWTELDGEWHLIKDQSNDGNVMIIATACGIHSTWNGTFTDHAPETLKVCTVCGTAELLTVPDPEPVEEVKPAPRRPKRR